MIVSNQWSCCFPTLLAEKIGACSGVSRFHLNLASLCLGSACIGLTLGWPETFITYHVIIIKCTDTCYDLSQDGSATIHLIVNLGACIGALVPVCLVDILGRRHNFGIAAISSILFWLILGIARDNVILMVGAALGGFAVGLFVVTSTMYVGEVSSSDQRGRVGSLTAFFAYLGVLISTTVSAFYNHHAIPFAMCLLSGIFLMTIYLWMIESPYYLYETGKTLDAKFALKSLRGAYHILDIECEYQIMSNFFQRDSDKVQSLKDLFGCSHRRFTAVITMFLLFISQEVGNYAMQQYAVDFFDEVIPQLAKVMIPAIDVVSIGICVFLIEKIGRKPILILSIAGSSICCLILTIDSILYQQNQYHLLSADDRIVEMTIVISYYATYSLGVAPILPVLTGEVFSSRLKTIGIGICVSMYYFAAMVNQTIFELINVKKGAFAAFLSFTVIGSLGLIFIVLFLPETRAKSLTEIQAELDDCNLLMF